MPAANRQRIKQSKSALVSTTFVATFVATFVEEKSQFLCILHQLSTSFRQKFPTKVGDYGFGPGFSLGLGFGAFHAVRYNSFVKSAFRVSSPPLKPLMVFDGDCNSARFGFAAASMPLASAWTICPFKTRPLRCAFPEIPRSEFATAVQLIEPDASVYSGAEAAFRALAAVPGEEWFLDWYTHSPAFARASEWGYRRVANNRRFFSFLTRLGWGKSVEPPSQFRVCGCFCGRWRSFISSHSFRSGFKSVASSAARHPAGQTDDGSGAENGRGHRSRSGSVSPDPDAVLVERQ